MTDAEFHQQQLDHQQSLTREHITSLAYRCLGIAQSLKECRELGLTGPLTHIEKNLIEIAKDYDLIRSGK